MGARFCGECGSKLSEVLNFCPYCGWKVVIPPGTGLQRGQQQIKQTVLSQQNMQQQQSTPMQNNTLSYQNTPPVQGSYNQRTAYQPQNATAYYPAAAPGGEYPRKKSGRRVAIIAVLFIAAAVIAIFMFNKDNKPAANTGNKDKSVVSAEEKDSKLPDKNFLTSADPTEKLKTLGVKAKDKISVDKISGSWLGEYTVTEGGKLINDLYTDPIQFKIILDDKGVGTTEAIPVDGIYWGFPQMKCEYKDGVLLIKDGGYQTGIIMFEGAVSEKGDNMDMEGRFVIDFLSSGEYDLSGTFLLKKQ